MLANVHFGPTSTLKELRLRLRAISALWPAYLAGKSTFGGHDLLWVSVADGERSSGVASAQVTRGVGWATRWPTDVGQNQEKSKNMIE